jgi:hypothetical protein
MNEKRLYVGLWLYFNMWVYKCAVCSVIQHIDKLLSVLCASEVYYTFLLHEYN